MAEITPVSAKKLPRFFGTFLSSPYIASWLGVQVACLPDLQEYALSRMADIDPVLLNELFQEPEPDGNVSDFSDRILCGNVEKFTAAVLSQFGEIGRFFSENGEDFIFELQFRLPFIHKSRLGSFRKKELLSGHKARYHSSFRQNYEGQLIVVSSDLASEHLAKDGKALREIPLSGNQLPDGSTVRLFLSHPLPLAGYWEEALAAIFEKCGDI